LNILLWLIRKIPQQNNNNKKNQVANSELNLTHFKLYLQVYVLWFVSLQLDLTFSSQDEFEIDNTFHCVFLKKPLDIAGFRLNGF